MSASIVFFQCRQSKACIRLRPLANGGAPIKLTGKLRGDPEPKAKQIIFCRHA
jgi:hypothetical protein